MSTAVFYGRVDEGGKPHLHNQQAFVGHLSHRYRGKRFCLTVSEPKKQRSVPQNAYYWFVVTRIAEETGESDPEQVHLGLRFRYLKTEDHPVPKAKSTTELSTKEFSEYVEKIIADAAMGEFTEGPLWIPKPGEGDAPEW